MEKPRRGTDNRKGVQSLFIPSVPKITVEPTDKSDGTISQMPHSRSAGELAMSVAACCSEMNSNTDSSQRFSNGSMSQSRSVIDIYCSPRLPRKSHHSHNDHYNEDGYLLDFDGGNNSHMLGPGSRTGSAVSLTSEYTSRSVGLISNDSSSDSTQFSDKMEQLKQKQNLLRRYVSNPEKQQSDKCDSSVQRNAKSVSNIYNESCDKHVLGDDIDSECTDSSMGDHLLPDLLSTKRKSSRESMDDDSYPLVTMITDDMSVKEGRIRQWLTDIGKTGN